jgi:hypothetical protein
MTADLIAGPSGINCTGCGAPVPTGALPHLCPVEAARAVMGGAPAALAAGLAEAAYLAGGPRCVEAVAGALRAMAARLSEGVEGMAPGPLRVYVAGGAAERLTVARPWIRRLQEAGVEVTHDWTGEAAWNDGTPEARAAADLDGVRRCDVLWLLCPAGKSEGSACELGAALLAGKRVVASGPWDALGRIFPGLAGVRCGMHEEGFAAVLGMVTSHNGESA